MQTLTLSAVLSPENGGYVALCPELDIASQGESIGQAVANLKNLATIVRHSVGLKSVSESVTPRIVGGLSRARITFSSAGGRTGLTNEELTARDPQQARAKAPEGRLTYPSYLWTRRILRFSSDSRPSRTSKIRRLAASFAGLWSLAFLPLLPSRLSQ